MLSWAYTAPPLRLKKRGLGELDVLITWGPLMVGGVYYAGTGTLPWQVLAAATVYALLPTTVLMGKHIDKLPVRRARSARETFPVVIGEGPAKALTQAMMVAYYVGVVALVALRALPWPALLTLGGAAHAGHGDAPVRRAEADRGAAGQPGLATVVGAARVHPHSPRGWPAHPRPARLGHLGRRVLTAPVACRTRTVDCESAVRLLATCCRCRYARVLFSLSRVGGCRFARALSLSAGVANALWTRADGLWSAHRRQAFPPVSDFTNLAR